MRTLQERSDDEDWQVGDDVIIVRSYKHERDGQEGTITKLDENNDCIYTIGFHDGGWQCFPTRNIAFKSRWAPYTAQCEEGTPHCEICEVALTSGTAERRLLLRTEVRSAEDASHLKSRLEALLEVREHGAHSNVLAITGIDTVCMIASMMSMRAMRATPPR